VFANSGRARLGGEGFLFKNGDKYVAFVFANDRARLGGGWFLFKNVVICVVFTFARNPRVANIRVACEGHH